MQYSRVIFGLLVSLLLACTNSADAQSPAASNPDKWEPAMKAFEESDKTNAPPQNAVLFIGSSSIRAWRTLAKDFPEHKVINRGFGGSEIADSVRYVDRIVLPFRPRTVVFYAGDNDLAKGKTPNQLLEDFQQFVSKRLGIMIPGRLSFVGILEVIDARAFIECSGPDQERQSNRHSTKAVNKGFPKIYLFRLHQIVTV